MADLIFTEGENVAHVLRRPAGLLTDALPFFGLIVLLFLSFPAPAFAEQPAIMVLNIKYEEAASPGLANILTGLVLQDLHDLKRFRVVGMKDVDQMLSQEQRKQLAGCTDTSCLVEIAGAMGTQYTLDGTVGVVGSSNVLSLTLIDVTKATVASRKTAVVKGENEQLLGIVHNLIVELMEPVLLATKKEVADKGKGSEASPLQATKTIDYPMNPYKLWGHVGVWGGLAVVGLGGLFSGLSSKAADDYNLGKDHSSAKDNIGTYNSLAVTGYVIGGVLLATGVTLWVLSPGDEAWAKENRVTFSPTFDETGVGLQIAGGW